MLGARPATARPQQQSSGPVSSARASPAAAAHPRACGLCWQSFPLRFGKRSSTAASASAALALPRWSDFPGHLRYERFAVSGTSAMPEREMRMLVEPAWSLPLLSYRSPLRGVGFEAGDRARASWSCRAVAAAGERTKPSPRATPSERPCRFGPARRTIVASSSRITPQPFQQNKLPGSAPHFRGCAGSPAAWPLVDQSVRNAITEMRSRHFMMKVPSCLDHQMGGVAALHALPPAPPILLRFLSAERPAAVSSSSSTASLLLARWPALI